ncbi:MAG: response regulator [Nitrospinaceae bacterium]|nr:response regulator [Nitrospinaceae bacterium]MBT3432789.1 response regulator [Nitrospinaceae bacterium]MBT3820137.1 response regulator [Nitrospinaceae bacterium]MBT4093003.1 response regulator [Nitrospinaceae bacterium]MBT4431133.1 response regulator [Nitrospinaceae bacterium]
MLSSPKTFNESFSGSEQESRPIQGRVLVAEDNPSNQLVATYMLEHIGYQADVVNNGIEAIEALKREKYDIILMDCQMPEMDGFEATRIIRESEVGSLHHISIIAMTAFALKGDRDKCLKIGMNDYISKPVTIDVLKSKIEAVLSKDKDDDADENASPQIPGEEPSIAPKVIAELLKLEADGAHNVIDELTAIFLTDSPLRLESIKNAINEGNADELKHSAHALKGSCTVIGAMKMKEICFELEKLGSTSSLHNLSDTLSRLETEFLLVQRELTEKTWKK